MGVTSPRMPVIESSSEQGIVVWRTVGTMGENEHAILAFMWFKEINLGHGRMCPWYAFCYANFHAFCNTQFKCHDLHKALSTTHSYFLFLPFPFSLFLPWDCEPLVDRHKVHTARPLDPSTRPHPQLHTSVREIALHTCNKKRYNQVGGSV